MTASSLSPAADTLPPPPPPPAAPRPRAPTAHWLVIGAAVAIALILLLAAFLGAFGGSSGTGGGGPGPLTYQGAQGTASAAAAPHGTWTLIAALGFAFANTTYLPLNFSGDTNCTVTSYSGAVPTNISLPAFQGNLTSGEAQEWLFEYVDAAIPAEMVVMVTGVSTTLALEVSGATCAGLTSLSTESGIPSNIVDSSVAVSAAGAAGATAFLAAHPTGVSLDMEVFSSFLFGGAPTPIEWDIAFSTCLSLFTAPGSGPAGSVFSVAVNATTGLVVPGSATNSTCGGVPTGPTIGQALTLGGPTLIQGAGPGGTIASQGCNSGDFCYNVPIVGTTDNVTPGDFDLMVVWDLNDTTFLPAGYAILDASGQVVVYSTGSIEVQWTAGVGTAATPLTPLMTLVVDMGPTDPSSQSMMLEITGTGPFSGSTEGISPP